MILNDHFRAGFGGVIIVGVAGRVGVGVAGLGVVVVVVVAVLLVGLELRFQMPHLLR